MEKQTWKVGNHPSIVVSDTKTKNTNFPVPPNKEESTDDEVEHYGGYFICESIGNIETAKLIAAAPEMLEALQILIGDIDTAPIKLTTKEKLIIARKAIKKATE